MHVNSCASSHDAEAVLSLANNATVVGDVAATLADIISTWARTGSNFDTIISCVVHGDWALYHRLVISRRREGNADKSDHTLYTGYSPMEPNGQLVRCHRGCGGENMSAEPQGPTFRITCRGCGSWCFVTSVAKEKSSIPGSAGIVKANYPQKQAMTQWVLNEPVPHPAQPLDPTPKRSTQPTVPVNPTSRPHIQPTQPRVPVNPTSRPRNQPTIPARPTVKPVKTIAATPPLPPSRSRALPHPGSLLALPPIASRSSSLPAGRPMESDPPPATPSTITVTDPSAPAMSTQTTLQPSLKIRIRPRPMAPPMVHSNSAPTQGSLKRLNYPEVELSTLAPKRRKHKK